MTPLVSNITTLLAIGTIFSQIIIILLAFQLGSLKRFVSKYTLELGFVVSLGSVLASLFYSNIAGFEPCEFCWWQRLLIYPQVILFAVALSYKRKHGHHPDSVATMTSLILSGLGILVGLYQYYGQMFAPGLLEACAVSGPSCSKLYFVSFGYITIPLMALTSFILLFCVMLLHNAFVTAHAGVKRS